MDQKASRKKLGLKERYRIQTRDLGWEPSYRSAGGVIPLR